MFSVPLVSHANLPYGNRTWLHVSRLRYENNALWIDVEIGESESRPGGLETEGLMKTHV